MRIAKIFQPLGMSVVAIAVCMALPTRNAVVEDREDAKGANGAVYVMNNLAAGNTIVVLKRAQDGTLTRMKEVSTGGLGSGPSVLPPAFGGPGPGPLPLQSQDSLIAAADGRFVIAVNARSNDISVLAVIPNGLRLTDRAPSGGIFPVSVTYHDGLVYVVNLGGVPTLESSPGIPTMSGFSLDDLGKLHPIPGSTRVTGAFGSSPSDIVFSPDGHFLVVAERVTNLLDVFRMGEDGLADRKTITESNGPTPFGMAFTRKGILVVTEGGGDQQPHVPFPNASSTSSYRLVDGALSTISGAVPTTQTAACWVRFNKNQKFAFVVNSGSGSISTYSISPLGELTLVMPFAADTGGPFSAAIDEAITPDGKFLYVDSPLIGSVRGFRVEKDGSLIPITHVEGFPVSFSGVVAF
jgi:6-phosphogluconolactonase (cycloisomerase 2 family)